MLTPAADIAVDATLVQTLLRLQHPDLARLELRTVGTGWDNAMFRLGSSLAVRVPRRASAAALLVKEQRWLPTLAAQLPIPVPQPVRLGIPSTAFPWHWSVLSWIEGDPADQRPIAPTEAGRLAEFLRALHRPAPDDAPSSEVRGVPLERRAAVVEQRLSRLMGILPALDDAVLRIWHEALAAPAADTRVWVHGDLHAQNVLVRNGAIAGIIDWGDITAGDPATDLAGVWMLLGDTAARNEALSRYAASADEIVRAKGWAVLFASLLLEHGLIDNPRHVTMALSTLRRLSESRKSPK
jgi:aminoglycoside phosphotransferase (APT) family kinase protein